MRQVDDGRADGCGVWCGGGLPHKSLVDSQVVDGETLEGRQGRVAHAEVINGQVHTQPANLTQTLDVCVHVVHEQVLISTQK